MTVLNQSGQMSAGSDLRQSPVLYLWNWKAATLSATGRAPIFLAVTIPHGWHAAAAAALLEAAYRAATAGFFGALIEAIRRARPRWLVLATVLVVIPAGSLLFDYLIHHSMGTPNLRAGISISFAVSAITSLFNWHSMRRGALLVGCERRTLGADLALMPWLIVEFVIGPLLWVWRGTRQLLWNSSEP